MPIIFPPVPPVAVHASSYGYSIIQASFETVLSSSITNEATTARTAESSLTTRVSTEESTARSAETVLTSAIASEATTARTAESSLTTRVSTEESTARSAETVLTSAIASEATTARTAEASLATSIAGLSSTVSGNIGTQIASVLAKQAYTDLQDQIIQKAVLDLQTTDSEIYNSIAKKASSLLVDTNFNKFDTFIADFFRTFVMTDQYGNLRDAEFYSTPLMTDTTPPSSSSYYYSDNKSLNVSIFSSSTSTIFSLYPTDPPYIDNNSYYIQADVTGTGGSNGKYNLDYRKAQVAPAGSYTSISSSASAGTYTYATLSIDSTSTTVDPKNNNTRGKITATIFYQQGVNNSISALVPTTYKTLNVGVRNINYSGSTDISDSSVLTHTATTTGTPGSIIYNNGAITSEGQTPGTGTLKITGEVPGTKNLVGTYVDLRVSSGFNSNVPLNATVTLVSYDSVQDQTTISFTYTNTPSSFAAAVPTLTVRFFKYAFQDFYFPITLVA